MHDYLSVYGIGDDWNDHIARGSAGGVDFLTSVGTPIYASESGYINNIPYNGTGGHTVTLIRDPNHSTQFMHLSEFVPDSRNVSEGEVIGYTGGAKGSDGSGSSTGPHCHAHSYDFGIRVPPFFLGSAAGLANFIPTPTQEEPMYKMSAPNRGVALVGANLFVSLSPAQNGEELQAAALISIDLGTLTDGRFDTIRDICTRGDRDFGRAIWHAAASA